MPLEADQLIKELAKAGLIVAEEATKLKRESLLSGRSVEELIHVRRLVDSGKIAELKSRLLKVPYQRINFDTFDQGLFELITEETARVYAVAPLAKRDSTIVVGMVHPDDLKAQEALKFVARRNRLSLGVYLISYDDWQRVLAIYSPYKGQIEAAVQALNIKGEGSKRLVRLEEGGAGEDAPIIRILADTLREAVQTEASDVHIEPQENYLRIRFRVDGDLYEAAALPAELVQPIVSRVKVISNLKIDEQRIPQDGRFRSKVFDREIDFRISTFPTPLGEKAAIRVLDPTVGLKTFDQLGLTGRNADLVRDGLEKPYGMILITGPTGSGKTTTLYALLQTLNKEDVNIVSLEDPVEYFVSGINQSQVRPEIGYDFASGLRQILRQDPDVIMVGEIRDNETAGLAIHSALTGHIVLSTLHTNNAVGVVPRLIDMKVEPFLIPPALNLMISQRLIPKLCGKCKVSLEAPPPLQKIVKKALANLPADLAAKFTEPYKVYRAPGCSACKGKGVLGRVTISEVLEMTPELAEILYGGATIQKILAEARRQGIISLRQDGVLKALEGLISLEGVVRETEDL